MKRDLLIITLTLSLLIALGILLYFTYERNVNKTLEIARRLVCKSNQQKIYSAIERYNRENNDKPSSLDVLVKKGYLKDDDIHCPGHNGIPKRQLYKYFSNNLGDPNKVLLYETMENNGDQQFIIKTMGDGKTVEKRAVE